MPVRPAAGEASCATPLRASPGIRTSLRPEPDGTGQLVNRHIDLSVPWSWSWEWLARDLAVAEVAASPHLVAARLVSRGPEEAVLARPYVQGRDIRSWASGHSGSDLSWLPTVQRELFDGLATLHRLGLVHGGLKPSNVWIADEDDQIRLLDAMVSRTQLAQPERSMAPEDVRYISPEQAGLVHRTVGFAADLYAAGWVLLEALAESNGTTAALPRDLAAGCSTTAQIARLLRAVGTPRPLTPLFLKLLAPLPEDRHDSAEDVLAALDGYDAGELHGADCADSVDFDPPLIGRTLELATLSGHVGSAASGQGVVVCLTGESGLGKSRLLEAVAAQAQGAGLTVLRGAAFDQAARRPLSLFQTVFADLATFLREHPDEVERVVAELGPALAPVVTLVPGLASVFGAIGPADGHTAVLDVPGPALAATAKLFALVGTERHPALLIVDDCQWADDLSWQLLSRIAASAATGHVTVVCASRPEALARIQAWELTAMESVQLDPLGTAESRRLIEAVVGPVSDELADYVVSHSDGNPLYTLSTLRALLDSSVLRGAGNGWAVEPAQMLGLPPILVPTTASSTAGEGTRTEAFAAARLARLSPGTRRAVQQAAVLGRQVSTDMLNAALDEPADDTDSAVAEAVRRGILRELPATRRPVTHDRVEFSHDRLRAAVLDSIDRAEEQRLHLRAAHVFSGAEGACYDYELAYHLHQGGESVAALRPALRAAEAALQQHALDVSETNLHIAAAGLESSTEAADEDRFRVREGLGRVYMLQGKYDLAADELETAYRTAQSLGELESARVAILRGELAFKTGEVDDAELWTVRAMAALRLRRPGGPRRAALANVYELIRLLLELVAARFSRRPRYGDERTVLAARLYNRVTYSWWFGGRAPVWDVWVGLRAVRYSSACGGARELANALCLTGAISSGLAPVFSRLSMRLVRRSLRMREAARDEWGIAQSHAFTGFVLHAGRQYADAIAAFDTAITAFEVLGDRWEQGAARWQQALCFYRLGRLHEAGAAARETFWQAKRIGDRIGAGTALSIWVRCLPADVSTQMVRRELDLTGRGDLHTSALIAMASGWKLLHMGDFEAAGTIFQEADRHRRRGVIRNHFVAPLVTSQLQAMRLWCDARPAWSTLERRRGIRAVHRRLFRALISAVVFSAERPAVLREWAMISFGQGRARIGRLQLRAAIRSARRTDARGELAACCHVAEVALGSAAADWAPIRGLPAAADVCRQLRLRVDRGVVEALSLRVMSAVADNSRHQALLTAARRIVTAEGATQILAEVRDATAATTSAVAVDVVPMAGLAEPAEPSGVATERVTRLITASGPTPLALVADYPFGDAAQHEQTADVLATLAGAVLERQLLRRESAERIVAVQEAERGRIARDLHDGLGHLFAGILEGTSAMAKAPDGTPGAADSVRELAKEGIRAVRTLAWSLRPDGLDDLGLVGCVEQLVEDCERMFGIPIDVTSRTMTDALPDTVNTAVYRIVQEALTNVGKHSGATEASVLLVISDGRLRAIVEDDGVGMEMPAAGERSTLGLSCMLERARLLGGRVEIDSSPGVGTTVMVEVPVNDDWRSGLR